MRFVGLLSAPSANHSNDLNYGRSAAFCSFCLPLECHCQCYGGAADLRRVREFTATDYSSATAVFPIDCSAVTFIIVRGPILSVAGPPVCVAAVLNAVSFSVRSSVVPEHCFWNRLGCCGPRYAVESRIARTLPRNVRYQNSSIFCGCRVVLTLCSCPRDLWVFFVLAKLGFEEAETIRLMHIADTGALYDKFRDTLIACFGQFEFENTYRATHQRLRQSGFDLVIAYVARTTDFCSHAYAECATES